MTIVLGVAIAISIIAAHVAWYRAGVVDGEIKGFREAKRLFTKDGENYVPPSEKYVKKRTHGRD